MWAPPPLNAIKRDSGQEETGLHKLHFKVRTSTSLWLLSKAFHFWSGHFGKYFMRTCCFMGFKALLPSKSLIPKQSWTFCWLVPILLYSLCIFILQKKKKTSPSPCSSRVEANKGLCPCSPGSKDQHTSAPRHIVTQSCSLALVNCDEDSSDLRTQ